MTDNKNVLPPSIIAALYKNVLFEPKAGSGPAATTSIPSSTGAAQKDTVVIHASPSDMLTPENDAFLQSILTACKLNKDKVAVISNNHPEAADHITLQETYAPKQVLLFGITPAAIQLPVHFPEFQVQSIGKVSYVCAPVLSSIQEEKQLKLQLWKTLQQLFQL